MGCKNSKINVNDRFADVGKMINLGKGGKEIRNTIKKLGESMPEDMSTPDKSLKELEKKNKKLDKFVIFCDIIYLI